MGAVFVPYGYLSYRIEYVHKFKLTRRDGWRYVGPPFDEYRVEQSQNEKLIGDYRKFTKLYRLLQVLLGLLLFIAFFTIVTSNTK